MIEVMTKLLTALLLAISSVAIIGALTLIICFLVSLIVAGVKYILNFFEK